MNRVLRVTVNPLRDDNELSAVVLTTTIVQAARMVRWTLRVRVLVVMLWTAGRFFQPGFLPGLSAQRSFLPQQSQ